MSTAGPLEDHTSEFASRNQFLFALLGLVSAKQKLDVLIARHGRSSGVAQVEPQHPFLLMILGAVRLGQSVRDHVAAWAAEAPKPPSGPTRTGTMAPGHAAVAEDSLETVARLLGENGYFRRSASAFRAGGSHKEWLHFAIHAAGLDLLVNFSIVDDIRPGVSPGTEIPRLTCLVRERSWDGDIEQFSPAGYA